MTTDLPSVPREAYGSWARRVAAALVDALVPLLVAAPFVALTALLLPLSFGLALVVGSIGYVGVIVYAVDQYVRQGRGGATLGKWLIGLRLVDQANAQPVGVARSLVRPIVHVIDALPVGAGYLAPLVDRRRQTFTDKALDSVVLRVPGQRTGALLPGLVLSSALLMLVGSGVAIAENSDDLPRADTAAAPSSPPVPPPTPSPTSLLPPEDLLGRIAPAAAGYTVVDDAEAGLGALDVRKTAELSAATPEEIPAIEADLRRFGLVEAFGRGYQAGDDRFYVVLVYRFDDARGALLFARAVARNEQTRPTTVPDAVVYDPQGDTTSPTGLFHNGSYVYEVAFLRDPGQATDEDLTPLLLRQYEFVANIDR